MRNVGGFLLALFWIPRLDQLSRDSGNSVFTMLRWFARLALAVYIAAMVLMLVQVISYRTLEALLGAVFSVISFPLLFRMLAGMYIWLYQPKTKRM